ncbi:MAG: hypothetical protein R8G34_13315 [Paracoccaceae bacterium]|nr:hypothetical protein [Paracoccaceae bacterium]
MTGVVFYSLSGHSRRLAQRLSDAVHGKLMELDAPPYQNRFFGYARAGYDSLMQRDMRGAHQFPSVAEYDRVILCGPVWTSYPAVPLRSFLRSHPQVPKLTGLILTCGNDSSGQKALRVAETDLGRPFHAAQCLTNSVEGTEAEDQVIAAFLTAMRDTEVKSQLN